MTKTPQKETHHASLAMGHEAPRMLVRVLWLLAIGLVGMAWFGSACGPPTPAEKPKTETPADTIIPPVDSGPDQSSPDTPAPDAPAPDTPAPEQPQERTNPPEPPPRDLPPLPPGKWPASGGGPSSDFGNHIAFDKAGNAFITGEFDGSATFGAHSLKAVGGSDIYVAKLDPTGKWLWAISAGSKGFDGSAGIAVDAKGRAFVTGKIDGEATFGKTQLKSKGFTDIFIARVDADGTWAWVQGAGDFNQDSGEGIAVAPNGDVLATGMFRANGKFGNKVLNAGPNDNLFVARLGPDGAWKWVVGRNDTRSAAPGLAIASDGAGNAYITGYYVGSATFGQAQLTPTGGFDTYVAQVKADGTWGWATQGGSAAPDSGRSIAANASGVIAIAGRFEGQLKLGASTLANKGKKDIFVAQLDNAGGFKWAKSFGGSSFDFGRGVALDAAGNTYLTGSFQQTLSAGGKNFQSGQSDNVIVIKLDKGGKVLWAVAGGGPQFDAGEDIAIYNNTPFVVGYFQESAKFGEVSLKGQGADDVFVWRIKVP